MRKEQIALELGEAVQWYSEKLMAWVQFIQSAVEMRDKRDLTHLGDTKPITKAGEQEMSILERTQQGKNRK